LKQDGVTLKYTQNKNILDLKMLTSDNTTAKNEVFLNDHDSLQNLLNIVNATLSNNVESVLNVETTCKLHALLSKNEVPTHPGVYDCMMSFDGLNKCVTLLTSVDRPSIVSKCNIQKGECIGLYAGVLDTVESLEILETTSPIDAQCSIEVPLESIDLECDLNLVVISTKLSNATRFIQDAVWSGKDEQYNNVKPVVVEWSALLSVGFVATRDIQIGETIYMSQGQNRWYILACNDVYNQCVYTRNLYCSCFKLQQTIKKEKLTHPNIEADPKYLHTKNSVSIMTIRTRSLHQYILKKNQFKLSTKCIQIEDSGIDNSLVGHISANQLHESTIQKLGNFDQTPNLVDILKSYCVLYSDPLIGYTVLSMAKYQSVRYTKLNHHSIQLDYLNYQPNVPFHCLPKTAFNRMRLLVSEQEYY
jgi:hypothetical protein